MKAIQDISGTLWIGVVIFAGTIFLFQYQFKSPEPLPTADHAWSIANDLRIKLQERKMILQKGESKSWKQGSFHVWVKNQITAEDMAHSGWEVMPQRYVLEILPDPKTPANIPGMRFGLIDLQPEQIAGRLEMVAVSRLSTPKGDE